MHKVILANVIGAMVALVVAVALYGQTWEQLLVPPQTNIVISDIMRVGNTVTWKRAWCKPRALELTSSSFVFSYAGQASHSAIPINVQNETLNKAVGTVSYPTGCFEVSYSALVPRDSMAGGIISGQLWYRSGHPFWDLPQDFGPIVVPPLPVPPKTL